MNSEAIRKAAEQIRQVATLSEKTAGEKLDSEKVLDFLKFYAGKGKNDGK